MRERENDAAAVAVGTAAGRTWPALAPHFFF